MKFEKNYIIKEIIKTTEENNGVPLGSQRFADITGIKKYDWFGKHWSKWSDALKEAGFQPNKFNVAYDEDLILEKLIGLIREMGKLPSAGELLLKSRNDKTFPSHRVFERLGTQKEKLAMVIEFCRTHNEMNDVLEICLPLLRTEKDKDIDGKIDVEKIEFGFVYLMKSGKFHKIGRSNDAERRRYELRIQLPEKLEIIHKIKTDDPVGIEEYWHKRFKDKRKNGEWFELSASDITAFKRRKFM